MKRILKLLFLPLLSVSLLTYVFINSIQPKLGLDLQGGISVILTAEENTDPELIEQAVEIMRTRIAAFGEVQEPEISISGENSVLVQLPGLENPDRIKSLLGQTAKMNFRMVDEKAMSLLGEKKYFVGSEVLKGDDFSINYIVKKRIGVSGDNLVDANASVDQFNRPIVSIRFDSIIKNQFFLFLFF